MEIIETLKKKYKHRLLADSKIIHNMYIKLILFLLN